MNIKNYTSTVPVIRSINNIEDRLVSANALHIAKTYEGNKPVGIIFQIIQNDVPMTFKLPAKIDLAYKYFVKRKRAELDKTARGRTMKISQSALEKLRLQAERTAWKILSDWVDIQVSLIELEQADPIELFLSQAFDGKQTFFERLKDTGFKQLTISSQG